MRYKSRAASEIMRLLHLLADQDRSYGDTARATDIAIRDIQESMNKVDAEIARINSVFDRIGSFIRGGNRIESLVKEFKKDVLGEIRVSTSTQSTGYLWKILIACIAFSVGRCSKNETPISPPIEQKAEVEQPQKTSFNYRNDWRARLAAENSQTRHSERI